MSERPPFRHKQPVSKVSGYRFPGIVETCYKVSAGPAKGQWRVVVTCTAPDVEGCQHIFAPKDLMATESVAAPIPKRT